MAIAASLSGCSYNSLSPVADTAGEFVEQVGDVDLPTAKKKAYDSVLAACSKSGHEAVIDREGSVYDNTGGTYKIIFHCEDPKKLAAEIEEKNRENAQAEIEFENSHPYMAIISCSAGNGTINPEVCFAPNDQYSPATNLEVRSGDFYKLYQYYEVPNSGKMTGEGIEIPLGGSFSIKAQDSQQYYILSLKIIQTKSHKIIYQKSVGQYGFISISK